MTDTAALRALAEATSTTGLDEAIEHTTSVARAADGRCSVEHLQLAEWLTFVESIHPVVISLCDRVDALEAEVERLVTVGAVRGNIREHCRLHGALDGADAQALEHAITITERERGAALARIAELEQT